MRILFVIHDFLPRHRGGAEIYLSRLASSLASKGEAVRIFTSSDDPLLPPYTVTSRKVLGLDVVEVNHRKDNAAFEQTWKNRHMESVFEKAILDFEPDVVHVHHLQNHSMGYVKLARKHGKPVVITLHDYYFACPLPTGGQLFGPNGPCQGPDPARCSACLSEKTTPASDSSLARLAARAARVLEKAGTNRLADLQSRASVHPAILKLRATLTGNTGGHGTRGGVEPGLVYARQVAAKAALRSASVITSPSKYMKRRMVKLKMANAGDIFVMPYGFSSAREGRFRRPPKASLSVLYLGTFTRYKGASVLVQAARKIEHEGLRVELFGNPRVDPKYVMELHEKAGSDPRIKIRGELKTDQDVLERMLKAHLLVVPSLWEENRPLVVEEAFSTGLPVAASNLGGLKELLGKGEIGPLFEPGDSDGLAGILQEFLDAPEKISYLSKNLRHPRTIARDSSHHINLYKRVLKRHATCLKQ